VLWSPDTPRRGAGDGNRARVGTGSRSADAKELEARVENIVSSELGGCEGKAHVVGIGEVDLVVIPAIAEVGEDVAAAGRGGFERVGAEHPVAEVDDVDVLLNEDVAGESAVPEPVAQAIFVRAFAFALFLSRGGRVVVTGGGDDFADGAGLEFFVECGDGRSVATLEPYVHALIGLDARGYLEACFACMMSMPTGFSQ